MIKIEKQITVVFKGEDVQVLKNICTLVRIHFKGKNKEGFDDLEIHQARELALRIIERI